jgi:anti-repressor protein
MNGLQVFNNSEFGEIRLMHIDSKLYAVGSDVAKALGYEKPNNAISAHCRYTLKRGIPHPQSHDKTIEVLVIPEGDIYRLIANSKLPTAQKFEAWVFDEVLPSISRTGTYIAPAVDSRMLYQIAAQLEAKEREVAEAQARIAEQDAQLAVVVPKARFADTVSASGECILIRELAKLLKQNGYDTGEKRLYEQLRQDGYLIKQHGSDYNRPTQKAMELGLFEVSETAVVHSDGSTRLHMTTKVTGKGQLYFMHKYAVKVA